MISKVSASPDLLIQRAVKDFESLVTQLLESKSSIRVLLTGGTLGIDFIRAMREVDIDFSRITLMFSDERFVALDHPDRNEHQAIVVFPGLEHYLTRYPASDIPLDEAREQLESQLEPIFEDGNGIDLTVLGIGPDGHVASLFPEHAEPGRWVIAEANSPKPPSERLSLSYAALEQSKRVWFLASGAQKAWAVSEGMKKDSVPASRVRGTEETVWYLDQELSDEL